MGLVSPQPLRLFFALFFSIHAFPTISEPGTGYKILNYLLLPITEEACKSTGQRVISAFVVCHSRFDIEVNSFIEVLTEWLLM